jgi:hypothetical protein
VEGLYYTTSHFKKKGKNMFLKNGLAQKHIFHQPYAGPLDLLGLHQTVSVRSEVLNVFDFTIVQRCKTFLTKLKSKSF